MRLGLRQFGKGVTCDGRRVRTHSATVVSAVRLRIAVSEKPTVDVTNA